MSWVMGNGGTGSGSSGAACGTSIGGPLLYSGIPYTGTGSIFYTDASLTTPFDGGSLWYKLYNTAGGYEVIVQINSSGVVIDSTGCTTTTTTTGAPTTTTTTTLQIVDLCCSIDGSPESACFTQAAFSGETCADFGYFDCTTPGGCDPIITTTTTTATPTTTTTTSSTSTTTTTTTTLAPIELCCSIDPSPETPCFTQGATVGQSCSDFGYFDCTNPSGCLPPFTTTTTTTTIGFDYYLADRYTCDGCTVNSASTGVCFPTGTSVTIGKFYDSSSYYGLYTYQITALNPGGTGMDVILEPLEYNTCLLGCVIDPPPTTTTTTTVAPTTTTTTTAGPTTTTTTTAAPTTTTTTTTCLPAGTFINQFCVDCELYYTLANGTCGTYDELQSIDSPECGPGCGPPPGVCCDCGYGCECGYITCDFGCFPC